MSAFSVLSSNWLDILNQFTVHSLLYFITFQSIQSQMMQNRFFLHILALSHRPNQTFCWSDYGPYLRDQSCHNGGHLKNKATDLYILDLLIKNTFKQHFPLSYNFQNDRKLQKKTHLNVIFENIKWCKVRTHSVITGIPHHFVHTLILSPNFEFSFIS